MALQIRRGTEAERLTITPLAGEVVFTTDTKYLYVGDGITVGGVSVSEQSQDAIASLVSGSHTGIYFTYNDSTNQLTATVTGGVDSLNTLTDVSISGAVNDHLLKYAAGVGWINGTIGIDVLNDVNIVNPVAETVLKYDGAAWINGRISLDSLSDVTLSSGWTLNDILYFNGTTWTNGSIPLEALSNVAISSPQIGHVLKWNGTNWINSVDELGDLGSTLDSLSDVIISTPLIGQTIKFDGFNWTNSESDLSSLSDVVISNPLIGQTVKFNGTTWTNSDNDLSSISDVDIASAVAGQTIMYTGFQWINVDNTLAQLNDVLLTSGWTTNEVLLFDGSKWTNSKVPLSSVTGVYVSTPAIGQVLKYDGFNWVNSAHGLFNDPNPTLAADLGLNNQDIIGIGNIDIVGTIKATTGLGGDLYLNDNDILGTGDISILGTIENQGISISNNGLITAPSRSISVGELTADSSTTLTFNQVDGSSAILIRTIGSPERGLTSKIKFEARGTSLADATATRLALGDQLGSIIFSAYEPSISNDIAAAGLFVKIDPTGSISDTTANGKLEFLTIGGPVADVINYLTFDSKGQLAVNKETAEATVDINGFMKLAVLTAEPATPTAGMVAIADGTS